MGATEVSRGPLLWTRSGLLAVVVVLLGSGAHVHGGGALPGAPWLLGLAAVAALAAAPLLREEATTPVLAAALVLGQSGVHLGLMVTAPAHGGHGSHGGLMLLAHALAAVGSGWWLARGEHALWTLVALLLGAGQVLQLLAAPVVTHRLAPVGTWTVPVLRETQVGPRWRPRRGPPAPAA